MISTVIVKIVVGMIICPGQIPLPRFTTIIHVIAMRVCFSAKDTHLAEDQAPLFVKITIFKPLDTLFGNFYPLKLLETRFSDLLQSFKYCW